MDILVVSAYAFVETETTREYAHRPAIHFIAMRNLIMHLVKSYPHDASFSHSRLRPVERSFSRTASTSSGTCHSRTSREQPSQVVIFCCIDRTTSFSSVPLSDTQPTFCGTAFGRRPPVRTGRSAGRRRAGGARTHFNLYVHIISFPTPLRGEKEARPSAVPVFRGRAGSRPRPYARPARLRR